jgi:hypothetical protein
VFGHHPSHAYPRGRPTLLILLEIAWVSLGGAWLFFSSEFHFAAIWLITGVIGFGLVESKLHRYYERTGQAVRLPRMWVVVRFPNGLPRAMIATRVVFVVIVVIVVMLGLAPISISAAKPGIIACVIALIALAFINLGLEQRFVRRGRATEVELPYE